MSEDAKVTRELPYFVIEFEDLPVRFTMRNGSHYTAICPLFQNGGDYLIVIEDGKTEVEKIPWYDQRIIHVGGWLTKEEINALQRGEK